MSVLPNLDAPDGFELAVFARSMLSQLPAASAPVSFEEAVLQKSTGVATPQTIRPPRRLGIGWKTTMASIVLLATLGSVTWFTGSWTAMGLTNEAVNSSDVQTENSTVQLNNLPALPLPPTSVAVPDIKKASPVIKRIVVKRGKIAVNAASRAVAGYPPGQ